MNRKAFTWRLRYFFQYIPFTLNTLICVVAVWISYKLLYQPSPKDEPAPFRPFIILMGKITFWFFIVLIGISILSTFFSWLYYKWLLKKKNYQLHTSFISESKDGRKNKLFMDAMLEGVRRPILGFVKGRLVYDDHDMTDKFSLLSNKRKEKSIWRAAITGRSRLNLPDIKEYQLKGGFIYFQDMLHLFSLAVAQPIAGQFYQPPVLVDADDKDVAPKKTESMDIRIEQMRRVAGEHLNYKDFEAGDDVRRIVWKVYAKNRDLVVRVPEMFEPYASHLYFYASFHATVKTQWLDDGYMKEMLNFYKNNIWTVYDTLSQKEWQLRYIPDQSFNVPEHLDEAQRNARIISNSIWQQDRSLGQYFNTRTGTVLCISSLIDLNELQQLLDNSDGSTVIYFVKLSSTFKHFVAWNWLKRLIFLPPADRLNKLRTRWTFAPMRIHIQKREKQIESMLEKSSVISAVL
ncbi:MAG: DUF58 domain-containing protein [Bacteroidota bacterium]